MANEMGSSNRVVQPLGHTVSKPMGQSMSQQPLIQPTPQQHSQPMSQQTTSDVLRGQQPPPTSGGIHGHSIGEVPASALHAQHYGEVPATSALRAQNFGEVSAPLPASMQSHHPTSTNLLPPAPAAVSFKNPSTALTVPTTSRQLIRGERHLFSTSDDTAMMKQIQVTHAPDGREFNVRPLLVIVQDIMNRANPTFHPLIAQLHGGETHSHVDDAWDDKVIHSGFSDILELLAYPIHKLQCEITCKCSAGGDAHLITMALCQLLSSYAWEAKVTIAFAAFAVNYGEFWLVAQLYTTNPLAKSIAILMELPEIMEHKDAMKQKLDALNNLINVMIEVTECIIKFKEIPAQYISPDSGDMISSAAHVPTAVYWTIRSIVACSSLLMNLIALGHEYIASAAEAWELSSLAHKLANIKEHLERQIAHCHLKLGSAQRNSIIENRESNSNSVNNIESYTFVTEEKRQHDAYLALIKLFEALHLDNMKILRALIYAKEDQLPLYDGTHKRRASLDVLRRKHVLLLISDLDMSHEELSVLHQMYTESRQQPSRPESQYEVVWMPVIDRSIPWTEPKEKQFELVQSSMPWYSVAHPMMLDPAVIRFIKEVWGFNKKPQLVVLDPQGKESNRNALHMMWIWGSLAFPFTKAKEEALWREESWRIELLADSIDQNIFLWTSENRYICLYGGEDMDWIKKFTTTAKAVANAARIPLEMLYVGKSNPKERVRRNNSEIQVENLSHVLQDITLIWFFWVRLESMWNSKVQHGMTVENDPIMQEIVTMLSYDGSERGWAVFCRGSHEMAKGGGEIMLQCLNQFDRWKDRVVYPDGFVIALNEQLHELHSPHHCSRLILPGTTGMIPDRVVCAECGRPMEKFIMYRCCTD